MNKRLIEAIDQAIRNILNENPATVADRHGKTIIDCGQGPNVPFKVKKDSDGKIHFVWRDNRQFYPEGRAYHSDIEMYAPGMEILRGRFWSDEKIASFYQSENVVAPYKSDIEKFFQELGEDVNDYQWDFDDSSETVGLKPWPFGKEHPVSKHLTQIPPEIQKKINDLLPQFHLATGSAKDKLKAELDALYKQAGIENAKEKELKAYQQASGEKKTPFEKGGGAGMASYRGRLPAIAEEKVRIYNTTLAPELWSAEKKLDPESRKALLQIAFDFYTDAELDAKIQDVHLLGSAANYNWTPKSDIDVHILVDGSQISMQPEEINKFFGPMVGKWNLEHDIKIKGHPVELYIQDIHEPNAATAIYSLVKDQWVKEPSPEQVSVDKQAIQKKYTMWVEKINDAIKNNDDQKLKKILTGLKEYRQAGLNEKGEFSTENLVFKILRSRGHIDRLKEFTNTIYDKKHSVKDGFDPTSMGPNPSAGVSQDMDNGSFYRHQNDRMRQMEGVGMKDLKSRYPQHSFIYDNPEFKKLTLDNLKSLRDKAMRFYMAAKAAHKEEEIKQAKKIFQTIYNEIKKRLEYINKPMGEGVEGEQIWLGWVDPSNHRVIAASGEEASIHDDMFNTYPETQQLDWEDAPKWRYRKDLNTVYWWGQMPDEDIRESLDIWLKRNLHAERPKHVRLRAVSWSDEDKENVHYSHGTMEEGSSSPTLILRKAGDRSGIKPEHAKMLDPKHRAITIGNEVFGIPLLSWATPRKWMLNRWPGAMKINFPSWEKGYNTPEEMVADLNKYLASSKLTNEGSDDYAGTYYSQQSDDEKMTAAERYFSIGQEDEETMSKSFCWIWDKGSQSIIAKKGGTHSSNFGYQAKDYTYSGWYDSEKNAISIVFPPSELRKLGGREPTEDDIPQQIYQHLIRKFGKRKPKFVVFDEVVNEGYGAGNPEEDRLKIKNDDGSVQRWRIRSKDAPKTPQMTKEIMDLVNEALNTVLPEIITEGELLLEHPLVKTLKKNKEPLTDEERKEVMRRGAVWHHGPKGEKTPAVWKSVVNGKTWYACNTHRAIQVKSTLKAAIRAFSFIKTTA